MICKHNQTIWYWVKIENMKTKWYCNINVLLHHNYLKTLTWAFPYLKITSSFLNHNFPHVLMSSPLQNFFKIPPQVPTRNFNLNQSLEVLTHLTYIVLVHLCPPSHMLILPLSSLSNRDNTILSLTMWMYPNAIFYKFFFLFQTI